MREALRNIEDGEYWVYGPTVGELDRVLQLVQKYSDYADACVERLADGTEVPAEYADAHAEVSSDLRYYNYLEKGLLWSFALWRLQGIFEAMLVSTFVPTKPEKPLVGLRSKLDAVGAAGYVLIERRINNAILNAKKGQLGLQHAAAQSGLGGADLAQAFEQRDRDHRCLRVGRWPWGVWWRAKRPRWD